MAVSRPDIEHLATLARIALGEAEKAKFEKELAAILKFVGELEELDTEGVAPLTGGTTLENVMRSDGEAARDLEGKAEELTRALPERKENWLKVKAVFE